MTTVCTICARGGSVGVPRKNIRMLHGKPLIAHTIEQALACPEIDRVFCSTDDAEIAEVAAKYGAEVPFLRPAEMATSKAAKLPVIEHLVAHIEGTGVDITRIIDLDPTSPLREVSDITAAAQLLDADTDVVITGYPAEKNPYFNMVEARADGTVGLVRLAPDGQPVTSRQMAPPVWAMNASIYIWHRETLSRGLWSGRARLYEMPHNRSVDIDSEIDFRLVEMLMQEKQAKQ